MKDLLISIAQGLVDEPDAVTVTVDEPDDEGVRLGEDEPEPVRRRCDI